MKPATLLLGAPIDAVLCDCGAEIRELHTLELPGANTYVISRGRFGAYRIGMNTQVEFDLRDADFPTAVMHAELSAVKLQRPFRASAACLGCSALMTYEFAPEGSLLAGTTTLSPLHVEP